MAQETHVSAAHGDTLDQIQVHQHQSSSDQRASGVCGRHSMSPCQRTGSAPSAGQDVVSEECLVVAPAGWCVLRQMHSNKYLFKCVLIHASNIKISLSPLSLVSSVIKTMRGSRGQKNDTGCRWQRREHNPPFRRSSEHSAARRAASSGRLHSPHSRPPVSRRRGSGVGQGLWRPPGRNGSKWLQKCADGSNGFR